MSINFCPHLFFTLWDSWEIVTFGGKRFPQNLEMLIFGEGGKPENPEKNPRSKDENQQQTQPTYDAGSGNRSRDILVGGERSHHCACALSLKKKRDVWERGSHCAIPADSTDLELIIELFNRNSWKFGRTRKSCGNTRLRVVFPRHFWFPKTSTRVTFRKQLSLLIWCLEYLLLMISIAYVPSSINKHWNW